MFLLHFIAKLLSELPYALGGYLLVHGTLYISCKLVKPLERRIKSERDKIILAHSQNKHKQTLLHCQEGRCGDLASIVSIDSYAT